VKNCQGFAFSLKLVNFRVIDFHKIDTSQALVLSVSGWKKKDGKPEST